MKRNTLRIFVGLFVLLLATLACQFSASTANISEAQMARDQEGTQPTTTFAPTDTFYCNVSLANAPDDTKVKAVWTAVSVEGEDPNLEIDSAEVETGDGTMYFELSNSGAWPAGTYKVDLYLNDKLDRSIEFQVE